MTALENEDEIKKLIEDEVQDILKNRGFMWRKVTDTPTDDLQVVNKKYVDESQVWSLVGEETLAGSATSMTATVTPKTYLKMLVFVTGMSGIAAISGRFNGDTGSNYNTYSTEDGSAISRDAGITSFRTDNSSTALDRFISFDIYNPETTTKRFDGIADSITDASTATGHILTISGLWGNVTEQITSITILASGGETLGAGSKILIFGSN